MARKLKVAKIVDGQLHCKEKNCKHVGVPRLIEIGYIVNHDLDRIEGNTIHASGWDGSSKNVSEGGEKELLECSKCFTQYDIPSDFTIEWH